MSSGGQTVTNRRLDLVFSETEAAGKTTLVAPIRFETLLPGSKDPYDLTVVGHGPEGSTVLHSATNVLIGDVYLVYGQSNAEARQYDGSANANKDNNIRTFGNNSSNPANVISDLTWYVAEGDDRDKKGFIGQWPLRTARRLLDVSPVAISILNGAVPGQAISFFQRNDASPEDLGTAYGRLLYRARRANVAGTVRGIFWYQGETDGTRDQNTPPDVYEQRFRALYEDLMRDYPAVEHMYVYQVRDGCGGPSVALRDRMRQFEDKFAKVQAVSTTGVNAHDGCHFRFAQGYEKIGDVSFRLAARDFYGSGDTQNIDPPFIQSAAFTNATNSEITLTFRDPDDQLLWEGGSELYFNLEGSSQKVIGGRAEGSRVVLKLSGNASDAAGVSYEGHPGGGPWVANTRGVGALVFFNIPISQADVDGDGITDGGDNCPSDYNPDQADLDSDGTGNACDDDLDGDGRLNETDNCSVIFNPDQADSDSDGIGDACDNDADDDGVDNSTDNCPAIQNPDQNDLDSDGKGDLCDTDIDGDGRLNESDNCAEVFNPDQLDSDADGTGDVCDVDTDGDRVDDQVDNCPEHPNTDQADLDGDGKGDLCDTDADGDVIQDAFDNCPRVANQDQRDFDGDGKGDACDDDIDGDGVANTADNCPVVVNPDQSDSDLDGSGDACDDDSDADGVANDVDNCPVVANPDQANLDDDELGDACDPDLDGDEQVNEQDNCPLIPNPDQADSDLDGTGDACDDDVDGDTVTDSQDNCPSVANSGQDDLDSDGVGDLCDVDVDGDGVANDADNCSDLANPDQADSDGDGVGDACEPDSDGDEIDDDVDNCPDVANPNQADLDEDGVGNACDSDLDGDSVGNAADNCPEIENAQQADTDSDGLGDTCDVDLDGDSIDNTADNCPSEYNPTQLDADLNGVGNTCEEVPGSLTLFQAYPNPARSNAVIQFALPEAGGVVVDLYDSRGQLVRRLAEGNYEAGVFEVRVDVTRLSAGTYFYTLVTSGSSTTRTLAVVP